MGMKGKTVKYKGHYYMVAELADLPGIKGLYQQPNSVHNTYVFAAGDSVTNLHVTLDRFKDQVEHLHGMKWR